MLLILYINVLDNVQGSSSSYVSPIWKYFEKDPKDETKAKCKICDSTHNRSGSSTSNLIKVLLHISVWFIEYDFRFFKIVCST
jgi:hypothetical protein